MLSGNAAQTATTARTDNYLETLLRLGQILNSSLDLHQVLETAIDQVISFVGAERGFILLVDIETGKVWGEALRYLEKEALEATLSSQDGSNPAEISRSIVEQVLATRHPIISYDAMEDPRFSSRHSVQLSNLRSVLCVPLIAQGALLGIIYLDNRVRSGAFSEQHLAMLSAFGNQAAVAIQNARLYQNLQRSMEERLHLQSELHQQETKRLALEEAGRLKSDFIGFVAHELRNPLTSIRGYVQTLMQDEDGSLSEEVRTEFYETIEAESDRLLDMINELLDVSRVEAGRPLSLCVKPVPLGALLEKLARRHHHDKYFTPRHRLVTEISPDLPPEIEADEAKLNQIVSNLLSNALKYSPNGGEVRLAAFPTSDGAVEIQVRDSGIGLTQGQIARLFQQYERVEREETRNIPGTGLGLYLVKCLIELHGGAVRCESVPGQGSVFILTLPTKPPIPLEMA